MKFVIICFSLFILCGCSSQKKFAAPPFGGGVKPANYSSLPSAPDTSLVASSVVADLSVREPIVEEKTPLKDKVLKRIAKTASKLFLPPAESSGDGSATASLVLGLVGLLLAGIVLGTLAIIFGSIALSKGTSKRGMAVAGIVLGILDVVVWVVFFYFIITASPF